MPSIEVIHRDPAGREPVDEALARLDGVRIEACPSGPALPAVEDLEARGVDLAILSMPRAGDVDRAWMGRFADGEGRVDLLVILREATEAEILSLVRIGVPYILGSVPGAKLLDESIRRILQVRALAGEIRAEARPSLDVSFAVRDWLEITAPSEPRFLERFHQAARILCGTRIPRRALMSLLYAISEIGLNAIEWGNEKDPGKRIRLSLCLLADRVLLKVEDEGRGFAHEGLSDPTADPAGHLARRRAQGKRIGGFGIWMVRGLMDEVLYSERGNTVILQMILDPEGLSGPRPEAPARDAKGAVARTDPVRIGAPKDAPPGRS
ncbi:MAG: ATP-binding protein [Planctomycetes bacterium]|nr:ATP-binding protein [Planctomycetota bacterium]